MLYCEFNVKSLSETGFRSSSKAVCAYHQIGDSPIILRYSSDVTLYSLASNLLALSSNLLELV